MTGTRQPDIRLDRFREQLFDALMSTLTDAPPVTRSATRWRRRALIAVLALMLMLIGLASTGRLSIPGVPDDVIARFTPWRKTNGLSLKDARLFLRVSLPPKAFVSDQYGDLRTWEIWRAPEKVGPPCEQSRMEFAEGETFGSVGCRGSVPTPSLKRLTMDSWQNAPGRGSIVFAVMWPHARTARGVFAGGRKVPMHVQGRGAWLLVPPHTKLQRLQMLNARGQVMHVDGDLGGLPG